MESAQIIQDEDDQPLLLFGSLVFLGAVFLLGLIINFPAVVICIRSRKLRGFTDKFILFVLAVDLFSLFTLIPISFLFVQEQSTNVSRPVPHDPNVQEDRPIFLEGESHLDEVAGTLQGPAVDDSSSSHCVQQWIFIVHKFIFIMVANLSVLGAFKIAVERYLAVVLPLHYHRFLKSSIVICITFTSVVLALICAVIPILDPDDFPTTEVDSRCYPNLFEPLLPTSQLPKRTLTSSTRFRNKNGVGDNYDSVKLEDLNEESPFSSSNVWWWWCQVLKLTHASVFFIVPLVGMIFMYLRIWTEARKQHARMMHHNKSPFIQIIPPDADATRKTDDVKVDGLQSVLRKFKLVQRLKRRARMDRAARVAVMTVGLLILCFGPLHYGQVFSAISALKGPAFHVHFWDLRDSEDEAGSKFKHILPTLLACLHPLLSPLVYVYRYQKVRSELKTFLKKKISRLNCCHDNHDPTDSPDPVHQFNNLAQALPAPSSADDVTEALEPPAMSSTVDSETIITVDVEYLCASDSVPELVAEYPGVIKAQSCSSEGAHSSITIQVEEEEEETGRQEYSESDIETHESSAKRVISVQAKNGLLQSVRCWMSSYSRWNQHRDSVASTASFITLLSNRSRSSIPSTEI